jgi:hypothetical protein
MGIPILHLPKSLQHVRGNDTPDAAPTAALAQFPLTPTNLNYFDEDIFMENMINEA